MMNKVAILALATQNQAISEELPARHITARSGMLDADSLLLQAEMFMAPDAFKRFRHFYQEQVCGSKNTVNLEIFGSKKSNTVKFYDSE